MAWSDVFRYLGLAMEAAEQAGKAATKIAAAQHPDSPGGKHITTEESDALVESLDENFSTVVTRICQEAGLPVKSVNVSIEIDR